MHFVDIVQRSREFDYLYITQDAMEAHTTYFDIFQQIRAKVIYLAVSYDKLPQVFQMYLETDYDFKAIIPVISVLSNEDIEYSLRYKFHQSFAYILVFELPHSNIIRDMTREVNIVINDKSLWMQQLIESHSKKCHKGGIWDRNGIHTIKESMPIAVSGHRKELF